MREMRNMEPKSLAAVMEFDYELNRLYVTDTWYVYWCLGSTDLPAYSLHLTRGRAWTTVAGHHGSACHGSHKAAEY